MGRTDSASATIAAAPEAVFAALTDPDARAEWLPPAGMAGHFEWFDARPGGGYRLVLAYDDPAAAGKSAENRDVVDVRFVEVEAPNRIVEECDFESDAPQFAGTMTMTWTIESAEGASVVTVAATDAPPGISQEDHVAGMQSSLENLARHLS